MPAKKKTKKWSPFKSRLILPVALLILAVGGYATFNYNQHHRSSAAVANTTNMPLLHPLDHPQVQATVSGCKYTYVSVTDHIYWKLKLYVTRTGGSTYVNSWYVLRHYSTYNNFIYRAEPASWWNGTVSSADITLGLKSQYPRFSIEVYHRNSNGSAADGAKTAIHYATDLVDCPL